MEKSQTRRRWGRALALVVAVGVLGTLLVRGSMTAVQVDCSLCVTYGSRTECRTGSGAGEEEAQRAAIKAACAVMANGMAESIACQNAPPANLQCPLP